MNDASECSGMLIFKGGMGFRLKGLTATESLDGGGHFFSAEDGVLTSWITEWNMILMEVLGKRSVHLEQTITP